MKNGHTRLFDFQFFSENHRKTKENELIKLIQLNNARSEHYVLMGLICRERNNFFRAESFFNTALEIDASDADANIFSCMILRERRMYAEAESKLNSLENIISPGQRWRLHIERGLIYLDQKKYEASEVEFQSALKLEPQNVEVLWHLGAYFHYTHNYRKSEKYYLKSIDCDETFFSSRISLAYVYHSCGNLHKSFSVLDDNLPELLSKCDRYLELKMAYKGRLLNFSGENRKSREILGEAIKNYPFCVTGYSHLGKTYLSDNNLDKAEETFKNAIIVDKYHIESYFDLSRTQSRLGWAKLADETLKKVEQFIDPSLYWRIEFTRFLNLKDMEDLDSTDEFFKKVSLSRSDSHLIFHDLGFMHQNQRRYEEAIENYKRSIDFDKFYLPSYWKAIYCCRITNKIEIALMILEVLESFDIDHLFWKIHCERSLCLAKLNKEEKGRKELQLAIEKCGESMVNLKTISHYATSVFGKHHDLALLCYSRMLELDKNIEFA